VIDSKVPEFAAQLRRRHGDAWPDVVRATAKMMLALGERPALGPEEFSSIPHEVFVTVGEKDTMVTAEESALAGSSLPAGRSLVLPGVPHPFEQVDLANLLVHMKKFFGLGRQD
jgi:hypothetical protein